MKLSQGLMALVLLAAPLSAQVAADQKTYVLAKEDAPLPVKQKFKSVQSLTTTDAKIKVEVRGQAVDGSLNAAQKEEIIHDFVSEEIIRVTTLKSRSLEKSMMGGLENNEEEIDPSEGKVFLLEKKEGKWAAKVEEGEVKEGEKEKIAEKIKELEKNFNENTDSQMYGTDPRKIGESWEVDPVLMPGMDDMEIKGGNLTFKFLEVKEFQGGPCAVLEMSFLLEGEMTEEEMAGMQVEMTGTGRVVRSLSLFTDLKVTSEMKMKMSGSLEVQPGLEAKMEMQGDMKIDLRLAKVKDAAEAVKEKAE